jgi:ribosomal protein L29
MKTQDIRNKKIEEIVEMIKEAKGEVKNYSLAVLRGSEKNATKKRLMKRDIARLQTVLNEKLLLASTEDKDNE